MTLYQIWTVARSIALPCCICRILVSLSGSHVYQSLGLWDYRLHVGTPYRIAMEGNATDFAEVAVM